MPTDSPSPLPNPCRPSECLAEDWLTFLGHRWNALTLWQLTTGPLRFSELQAALPGISPKVLTERLNGLTTRGLVTRSHINAYPREVQYELTRRGAGLGAVVLQLYNWAEKDAMPDSTTSTKGEARAS